MAIPDPDAQAGGPGRPWAMGMGLVLLGLLVAMISNAYAIQNKTDPSIPPYTNTVYALGLLVSGWGVHKLLWFRPSTRPAFLRVLLTAVVTVPVFVLTGILLSFIFLMMFYRFG